MRVQTYTYSNPLFSLLETHIYILSVCRFSIRVAGVVGIYLFVYTCHCRGGGTDTWEYPAWLGDESNVDDSFLITRFPQTVYLRRCVTVQSGRLDLSMERELRGHCESCGRVVRIALVEGSGGCTAYVEYEDEESAINAIDILNAASLEIQGPGDSPAQRLRLKVTRTCFLVTLLRPSNPPLT